MIPFPLNELAEGTGGDRVRGGAEAPAPGTIGACDRPLPVSSHRQEPNPALRANEAEAE